MAYIAPKDRYEDLKSSAFAFLWVGIGACAIALLLWLGILKLPVAGGSGLMFKSMLTVMGIGSFIGGVIQLCLGQKVKAVIGSEEDRKQKLFAWFDSKYTADTIDDIIKQTFPGIITDELDLKRLEYIQDCLVTGQDLPDEAYVEAMTEEIYQRLYE